MTFRAAEIDETTPGLGASAIICNCLRSNAPVPTATIIHRNDQKRGLPVAGADAPAPSAERSRSDRNDQRSLADGRFPEVKAGMKCPNCMHLRSLLHLCFSRCRLTVPACWVKPAPRPAACARNLTRPELPQISRALGHLRRRQTQQKHQAIIPPLAGRKVAAQHGSQLQRQ